VRAAIPTIRLKSQRSGRPVARDGVVICFFMRRSHAEVAPAVWRALQTYLQAVPPDSLNWYASSDGDTLPLDEKGWAQIRYQILERPWGGEWIVELEESADEVGGHLFEYDGRKLDAELFAKDETATSGVLFSFPTEYLLEHGPNHLRELALSLGHELPFSFGYASLAVVAPHGFWSAAYQELERLLSRHLGLDVFHLRDTSLNIGTKARGAYWLTFLGQPLLKELGGETALREKLPFPEVSLERIEGERLLVTLGEWPEVIDTAQTNSLPRQYRALAYLLEPFLYEERTGLFSADKEHMRQWLRRLCQ
jgi:hypothetical protein